eukprot:10402350-Alexandrium_andersonii.AAC.2
MPCACVRHVASVCAACVFSRQALASMVWFLCPEGSCAPPLTYMHACAGRAIELTVACRVVRVA